MIVPFKVYSLFEEHTELLKRGKAGKPIEFGHKVLLAETGEKFILHYSALAKQQADKDLLYETIKAHRKIFVKAPEVLAANKGFMRVVNRSRNYQIKLRPYRYANKEGGQRKKAGRKAQWHSKPGSVSVPA